MADHTPKSDRPIGAAASGATGGNGSSAAGIARATGRLDYAPARPGRLHRGWSATRRWARDTFARDQLAAGFRQLMWVAPLTLLIWVYADREQQVRATGVPVAIEVRSTDPKFDVRLVDPESGVVSIDLRGPRSQLDDLRTALSGPRAMPLRFDVGASFGEGTHRLNVGDAIRNDDRFAGVAFEGGQPSQVSVYVDPVVEVTAVVQVEPQQQGLFEPTITFVPSSIKVRGPSRVLAAARDPGSQQVVAYADLSNLPDQTPGPKTNVPNIPVRLPNADPNKVTVEPATVSASLVKRAADKEFTIDRLLVEHGGATSLLNTVQVTLDNYNLLKVVVVGPADAITSIEAAQGKNVRAQVTIDTSDINVGPHPKSVWFLLPQGVKVKSVEGVALREGQQPTVEVTVTSRGGVGQPIEPR